MESCSSNFNVYYNPQLTLLTRTIDAHERIHTVYINRKGDYLISGGYDKLLVIRRLCE